MKPLADLIKEVAYWEDQEALGRPVPMWTYMSLRDKLHFRIRPRLLESLKPKNRIDHGRRGRGRGKEAQAGY